MQCIRFFRRHRLMTAITLLVVAALLYFIGVPSGSLIVILLALTIEMVGWVMLLDRNRGAVRAPQDPDPT